MDAELAALPDDVETLKAALLAARAETAVALAEQSSNRALIAHLKLQIEKLNRDRFGPRSERTARLLDQMELQLEELETAATEDELAAETAAAKATTVTGFTRARPARRPFPEHLPRERVVVPGPVACACCGSARLSKLGEDVTESLEDHPPHLEGHPARAREVLLPGLRAHQPAPGAVPRDPARLGRAEPAVDDPVREVRPASAAQSSGRALCSRGRADQPVHAGRPGRHLHDGADAVVSSSGGPCHGRPAATRRRHHGAGPCPWQDRHRPALDLRARRPAFGGPAPPGAVFYYSRDRGGEHPQSHLDGYAGLLQADAYGGYGKLYEPGRKPGPILEAACWAHARRKFFVLADVAGNARRAAQGKSPAVLSPICLEAVQRIDALFDIEREINGHAAQARQATRQSLSAPLVADLHRWLGEQRGKLARGNDVARAIDYL